jgi:hypothetical protein
MVPVRSKSLQLVEAGIGTLQLVDTIESMDVDDLGPMIHRSPSEMLSLV